MDGEKHVIHVNLHFLWIKAVNTKSTAKEINEVKNLDFINKRTVGNLFKKFNKEDLSLKDKFKSGMQTVVTKKIRLEVINRRKDSTLELR